MAGSWTEVQEARIVLVAGSARFCKSLFDSLVSRDLLRDTDKVVVVASGRHCFDLPIKSRWTNLYHNSLGGVTCGRSRLGVSAPLLWEGQIPVDESPVRRSFAKLLHVAEDGNPCAAPAEVPVRTKQEPVDSQLAPLPSQLSR